jgi:hypothetical protein
MEEQDRSQRAHPEREREADLHDQLRPHLTENEQSDAQHRNPRHALSNDHHGYDSSNEGWATEVRLE